MYAPLNVKTTYSFLSSVIEIDDLLSFAKKYKLDHLFICDVNMYGTMEFILKCQSNHLKPIIGVDFGDCLLYAKSYLGYQNLMKLTTINSTDDLQEKDFSLYKNDLLCIVLNLEKIAFFKEIFADIYINYDLDCDDDLLKIYAKPIYSLDKEKLSILKCLNMLRDNKTIADEYFFDENCVVNDDIPYIDNLVSLIQKCSFSLPKYALNLPKYALYNDTKGLNDDDYLYNLSISGLTKRLNNQINVVYQKRLLYELDVIKKMGFSNYFLVVYDFIKYAKINNILVGPGRGSACGSLVSYSLGITDVDPIKYDLLFERFLNIERVTMPDIDIDFPDDKRDLVIDYVVNKYGLKNVCAITTFGTFGSKMAIRDIGRVLNVPLYTIDEMCKIIGNKDISLKELYQTNSRLKGMIDSDIKLKNLYQIASQIEGMKRHTSIHAAGIVMSNDSLDNYIPLVYNDNMYLSSYEASYLEDIGLLKIDFLGLRNLTIIDNALKLINEREKVNLKFSEIPLNDPKTFTLFQKGDTLGIFQFESNGMRNFLKDLKPDCFMDLANANALYRPGPSENIPLYIKRKNNGVAIDYYDDSLKRVLSSTYGIIVYQEQIMQIAHIMANYSLAEADILRKAMSKKKLDVLENEKDKFINGAIKNKYSPELALKVYHLILSFASYGFNKSHSVAYSVIAYKMAYLKANYPLYFYLAILNSVTMDSLKTKDYLREIRKYNIKVLKPDINRSLSDYQLYYNNIILPFTKIKGISKVIADKIIMARDGGFKDIYDFFSKMMINGIPRNVIEALIDSDALNVFGYNHQTLYENLEYLLNYGNLTKDLDEQYVLKPEITICDEFNRDLLINREKELFGLFLTNHPVVDYKVKEPNCVSISDIAKYFNKEVVTIVMIESLKEIKTKKGDQMLFMTASDEEDSLEYVLFPKVYLLFNDLKKGDIIKVVGKVERRSNFQIIVSKIERLK